MNIEFDKMGTKMFFEWMAAKIIELTMPVIKQYLDQMNSDEELLTRKEVSERIFKCDEKTFDKCYRYADGFPKINQGTQERYPKKLVERWIRENSTY